MSFKESHIYSSKRNPVKVLSNSAPTSSLHHIRIAIPIAATTSPTITYSPSTSPIPDDSLLDSETLLPALASKSFLHNTDSPTNSPSSSPKVVSHRLPPSISKYRLVNFYNRQSHIIRRVLFLAVFVFPILFICYRVARFIYSLFETGYFDENVEDKIIVIYPTEELPFGITRIQGFFSDFMAVIGAVIYAQYSGAAGVRVIYNNPLYVEESRGSNYFDYFFESSLIQVKKEVDLSKAPEIHFNRYLSRLGKFGSFSRFAIGYKRPPEKKHPIEPFQAREYLHEIIEKYIHVKPFVLQEVQEVVNSIYTKAGTDNVFILGVHFRGTDKKKEYPFKSPSFAVFDYYIQTVLKIYGPGYKKLAMFVASDETDFLDWIKKRYASIAITYLENGPRVTRAQQEVLDIEEMGVHKAKQFTPYEKAHTALLDAMLLARTDYVIKCRSSLSDVTLLLNDKINWTQVLGGDDPATMTYTTDLRIPGPPKGLWDAASPMEQYNWSEH